QLKVGDGDCQPAALRSVRKNDCSVHLGSQRARMKITVKGETVYVRAFDQTFTLTVMNPVEQAAQASGKCSNTTRAPMPGTVVAVDVADGDRIIMGQPMITIESMKILTVITAPRNGEVSRVHFKARDTFEKGAALITLSEKEAV
ncbi:MAG: acetyl-CoA carboxylase biotin carboxyl carrier protein subunit, partial [Nitrospinales bacterium]